VVRDANGPADGGGVIVISLSLIQEFAGICIMAALISLFIGVFTLLDPDNPAPFFLSVIPIFCAVGFMIMVVMYILV